MTAVFSKTFGNVCHLSYTKRPSTLGHHFWGISWRCTWYIICVGYGYFSSYISNVISRIRYFHVTNPCGAVCNGLILTLWKLIRSNSQHENLPSHHFNQSNSNQCMFIPEISSSSMQLVTISYLNFWLYTAGQDYLFKSEQVWETVKHWSLQRRAGRIRCNFTGWVCVPKSSGHTCKAPPILTV